MWKLKIAEKTDEKLAELFPQDPFSDITVLTHQHTLRLSSAYLVLQSPFFSNLNPSTRQVDLSHLPSQALFSVLKTLYGDQLVANSCLQLQNILMVINFLDLNDLRQNIQRQLLLLNQTHPQQQPLLSIDILEFSFKNNILKPQICQLHFQNQLASLHSNKNYLQLAKLSPGHLNQLLLSYSKIQGSKGDKIVNSILENYINRKGFRPAQYLQSPELDPLKKIWEDFHHKITYRSAPLTQTYPTNSTRTSTFMDNLALKRRDSKLRLLHLSTLPSFHINEEKHSQIFSEQKLLDIKLLSLEIKNKQRDDKIKSLHEELKWLRKKLETKQKQNKQGEDLSLLQNIRRSKHEKDEKYFHDQSFTTSGTTQNAFELFSPFRPDYQDSCNTPKFVSRNHLP